MKCVIIFIVSIDIYLISVIEFYNSNCIFCMSFVEYLINKTYYIIKRFINISRLSSVMDRYGVGIHS